VRLSCCTFHTAKSLSRALIKYARLGEVEIIVSPHPNVQAPLMNEWLAPLQIRPVRGSYMTLLEKDTSVI
jgi:hypothetical protein